jgi:2-polyprenyl-3-methyl-5-hydroxy-6-metoxy-1,4-benzoquinol methylase
MRYNEIKNKYDILHAKNFSKRLSASSNSELFVFQDKMNTEWHKIAKKLINIVGKLTKKSVLEVGCGYGSLSVYLSQLGATVTGIDLSSKAIELSKRNAELSMQYIKFKEANAVSLPFKDEEFDLTICCDTLEHIPNYKKAIRELIRTTRIGGHLIITVPNILSPKGIYLKLLSKQPVENCFTYWTIPVILKRHNILISNFVTSYFSENNNEKRQNWTMLCTNKYLNYFALRVGFVGVRK